jgi:hypothetical protein
MPRIRPVPSSLDPCIGSTDRRSPRNTFRWPPLPGLNVQPRCESQRLNWRLFTRSWLTLLLCRVNRGVVVRGSPEYAGSPQCSTFEGGPLTATAARSLASKRLVAGWRVGHFRQTESARPA